MQHRVSKFALLALLCLASTRVHGVRPLPSSFPLASIPVTIAVQIPLPDVGRVLVDHLHNNQGGAEAVALGL